MNGKTVWRWVRRVWVTAGLALTGWIVWNAQAHGLPAGVLDTDAMVRVETSPYGPRFVPTVEASGRAALIFLPGGGIDPRAYTPFVRSVAGEGYPAAIVTLPWRTAPTDASRDELFRRILETRQTWAGGRPVVLAGHSRGAALAGRFAAQQAPALAGLVLIATTHPRDEDLSVLTIPVTKILGTRDCVASVGGARANAAALPAGTTWVEIPGANHAQFGHYGSQINDCRPEISRDEQQARARAALVEVLAAASR